MLIEPRYSNCGEFSEGYAWVEENLFEKYYINTNGIRVTESFKEAGNFKKGVARVILNKEVYNSISGRFVKSDKTYFLFRTPATLKEWLELAVMPWETYSKDKIKDMEPLEPFLKRRIESEINAWQKKGEFESTAEWQKRVNERTR